MRFLEILLIATVITGLIWLIDSLFFREKRLWELPLGPLSGKVRDPWYVEYSKAFFPILLIVLILRSFLAEPFRIPSGSMHPTLWEGDFILVNKYYYGIRLPVLGTKIISIGEPKRGDIIVFKHDEDSESKDMIKRVVGLPGDQISYKENILYVNGKPAKQKFITETNDITFGNHYWPVRQFSEELDNKIHDIYIQLGSTIMPRTYKYNDITVPKGSYFVMGDNRDNSSDSRDWGFVKDEDILGRAFAIWMSWDSQENDLMKKIRWDRLGTSLK